MCWQAWGIAALTTGRITCTIKGQVAALQAQSLIFINQRTSGSRPMVNTWCWCTVQGQPACIYCALCHAGEAFDKVARLLGLELRPNGGAALEAFARQGDPYRFKFTVPLQRHVDCNFSYAGLKNSVRLAIEAEAPGAATEANLQVCSKDLFVLCVNLLVPCPFVALHHRHPSGVQEGENKGLCVEVNTT